MKDTPDLFAHCRGVVPLRPRLENWMTALLGDPARLQDIIQAYGAPVNIQSVTPFCRNIATLRECVADYDLPFLPMFARKANKCLTYIDAARDMEIGVDTASHAEVAQCLEQGVPGQKIVCTAAVKNHALMTLCAQNGVTIILDNFDEITLLETVAQDIEKTISVGLRMNGFSLNGTALYSRFGFALGQIPAVAQRLSIAPHFRLDGLHFHLNGYSAADRVAAITQSLPVIAQVRAKDRADFFLDIGGGMPMNYLADATQWDAWVCKLDAALAGKRAPITQHNDGLGRKVGPEGATGSIDSYPVAQSLVQTAWMRQILDTCVDNQTIAKHLQNANITLRCEPGRSVLDGCGLTVARIAFCKNDSAGTAVIGIEMNRTQSRSGFAEFALDPLMVPGSDARGDAIEGYLAGTYCTESEWLTRRKMVFPNGVRAGDLMVFPNTAGYLMHFLESRSHQFPLAKNVFVGSAADHPPQLDAIDRPAAR